MASIDVLASAAAAAFQSAVTCSASHSLGQLVNTSSSSSSSGTSTSTASLAASQCVLQYERAVVSITVCDSGLLGTSSLSPVFIHCATTPAVISSAGGGATQASSGNPLVTSETANIVRDDNTAHAVERFASRFAAQVLAGRAPPLTAGATASPTRKPGSSASSTVNWASIVPTVEPLPASGSFNRGAHVEPPQLGYGRADLLPAGTCPPSGAAGGMLMGPNYFRGGGGQGSLQPTFLPRFPGDRPPSIGGFGSPGGFAPPFRGGGVPPAPRGRPFPGEPDNDLFIPPGGLSQPYVAATFAAGYTPTPAVEVALPAGAQPAASGQQTSANAATTPQSAAPIAPDGKFNYGF